MAPGLRVAGEGPSDRREPRLGLVSTHCVFDPRWERGRS